MKIVNLAEQEGLPPLDWESVAAELDDSVMPRGDFEGPKRLTTWLTSINADGSPHVTAIGALWLDGAFWFQTGTGTRKGRNVARDPRCSVAVSVRNCDVVVEGEVSRVTDKPTVTRLAEAWAEHGWPASVDESGSGITAPFNAPSVGPPPWTVYRVTPHSATVVSNLEPGGSTRFGF
jgi:hypothetical protein